MGAPPSPDYILGPEAPPSPDYILGPEYPEYLPPADDMLPAEEQPLPAAISPTAESPRYIADSEPKMDPEEKDGDDEESEEDSIDYPTSRGDDDANDEDEEESSDREEEEEEHLAPTVFAPALHSESSVAAAARKIRPTLTIVDKRRADDKLIGRLRRERRYFRTLATTYAHEIEALQRDVSTLQRQHIDDEDRLTMHIQHEHAQRDVAPEDGDSCS
nr:hypothetical protein [Tanacetum cinerariifolium]GFB21827.1 hypothetical protein [Tanacetum cinerariifolium]